MADQRAGKHVLQDSRLKSSNNMGPGEKILEEQSNTSAPESDDQTKH